MRPFIIRPDEYSQFGQGADEFCLVTEAENTDKFILNTGSKYLKTSIVGLEAGETLGDVLSERSPEFADVLVVCTDTFLTSPAPDVVGQGRRVAVLPCGSTPTTDEQVSYLLGVAERTDATKLESRCGEILSAIEAAETVTLKDEAHGTEASLDPRGDYEWNQQAQVLAPGEQQVTPPGKLSVLPAGVMGFDSSRRLALSGSVALKGIPIVHRADEADLVEPQRRLFERLDSLRRTPVILDLTDGAVSEVHPTRSDSWEAAETLNHLMCRDDKYSVVWEFGIGLNDVMEPVAGNCGLNEMYGRRGGVLHLEFGRTPTTPFALCFVCPGTTVRAGSAEITRASSRRTLNRRKAASCGCN